MNYLSVEKLTKSFGERVLFENLTFGINKGQKVGLVAKNGSGKSTLLDCLLGKEHYDDGRVVFRNDIQVGFLEQAELLNPTHSIMDEVLNHDLPKLKLVKAYKEAMRDNDEGKIASLFEALSELDAWDFEVKVEQILSKLNLTDSSLMISNLSGGQKKRVALAKVLLAEPDFLILDEPTNHLDLDMIEWLEDHLSSSNSTILMVTHDRYFLEVVADTIIELDNQQLYTYEGNFSYYLEQKAAREEQEKVVVGKARSQFKKELDWIRRQPKARGTKQKARVEAFHETKKVAKTNLKKDDLIIHTKMERLGTKILEIHKLSKSYDDKKIVENLSYNFKREERLGIVGPNGAGKSTFLKMIMGEVEPDNGKVVIGDTVVFGYYSQENIKVDDEMKVIDVIRDVAEYIPLEKGRELSAAQFLEQFLFPRSMHHNFVHKLSGGEKRRLKLMKVLMSNPNFLILDEPTNDLDIFVLSVLENYLKNFQGCLIVVSHDRYFMDKMVDHIFVFKGDGEIKDIIGNYTAFREKEKADKKNETSNTPKANSDSYRNQKEKEKTSEKKKLTYKEKIEFEKLDAEIVNLENEKDELSKQLEGGNLEDIDSISKRLAEIVKLIEEKSERWMELADFA